MKKEAFLTLFFLSAFFMPLFSQTSWETAVKEATDSSLPLVHLEVDVAQLSKENYTPGRITIFDPERRTEGRLSSSFCCKVRYRGATSLRYEKKSFAVKLLDENGENLDANVLGIRNENDWILDAMAIDRIRMRNRVCFDLWNEMNRTPYPTDYDNRNGTAGEFVEVFLNGEYHGLFCLSDKIDRKLLGLKKARVNDDGTIYIRGVLYKGNTWSNATQLWGYDAGAPTTGDTWEGWELQHPDDYPCHEAWQPLMNLIDFCATENETFWQDLHPHFYQDNLIDFGLFLMGLNIIDNILKNAFLSCPDTQVDGRFLITPWDLDCSLGGLYDGSHYVKYATWDNLLHCRLYWFLYEHEGAFRTAMGERWKELSAGILSQDNVERHLDHYADRFRASGAWQREKDRWEQNPVPLDLDSELDYVKEWYATNRAGLDSLFEVETGIHQLLSPGFNDGSTYLIDGRRVTGHPSQRGIYIRKGRKFVR